MRACLTILLCLAATLAGGSAASGQMPGGAGGDSAGAGALVENVRGLGEVATQALRGEGYGPEKPKWDSTASPRESLLTFRENMLYFREGFRDVWPRIEATLDRPQGISDDELRRAAMALDRVLDRFGEIRPGDVPGPEAIDQSGVGRVEVFPRLLNHQDLWQQLGDAPDGEIVMSRGGDGGWRFEVGTVAGAADLLASVKAVPPRFTRDEDAVRRFVAVWRPTVEDTPWSDWLWFGLTLAGGLLVGYVVAHYASAWARRRREADEEAGRIESLAAGVVREVGPLVSLIVASAAVVVAPGFLRLSPTLAS